MHICWIVSHNAIWKIFPFLSKMIHRKIKGKIGIRGYKTKPNKHQRSCSFQAELSATKNFSNTSETLIWEFYQCHNVGSDVKQPKLTHFKETKWILSLCKYVQIDIYIFIYIYMCIYIPMYTYIWKITITIKFKSCDSMKWRGKSVLPAAYKAFTLSLQEVT